MYQYREPIDGTDMSEFDTRRVLIDKHLARVGWVKGRDWMFEVELEGMPNVSKVGYADYVLYGDNGLPLAVIEAKRTSKDVDVGRQQAKLYSDLLVKKYNLRYIPLIYLTNGYDTVVWDRENGYVERKVSEIPSKRDLLKWRNISDNRRSMKLVPINNSISNRDYQKAAIRHIIERFEDEKQRKALVVMATGTGKTRTVISLIDVMFKSNWVRNILFLADRNVLVTQAKDAAVELLPNVPVTDLTSSDADPLARCVFSTYQTMIGCVDKVKDEDGELLFTSGHFDLIICDEAHRSIYNRYHDIIDYFDSLLVGLTATPKDEVDRNTYETFNLSTGNPTYAYEYRAAVNDGWLVDYRVYETKFKFLTEGIVYDDLSDEDKDQYESAFIDEGVLPERIDSSALNSWVFNEDTIERVLASLMENGIKIENGSRLGKTIIFAQNHNHAVAIKKVFDKYYAHLGGEFSAVIDYSLNYAKSAIDDFKYKRNPQIAISVDMMDTGVDVPEVVNLVFFKKVYSKSKFHQMIGRGTRLCPKLLDGMDKKEFFIFDFCGNFEFFRMVPNGFEGTGSVSVQERIFSVKVNMIHLMQEASYQTEEYINLREQFVEDVFSKISELNRDDFNIRMRLRALDRYKDRSVFRSLSSEDVKVLTEEVAHLVYPYKDDFKMVSFDSSMFTLQMSKISNMNVSKVVSNLMDRSKALMMHCNIPEIAVHMDSLRNLGDSNYLRSADIFTVESLRVELRELMKYLDAKEPRLIHVDLEDSIQEMRIGESIDVDFVGENYREKVEHYIRAHMDEGPIFKLRSNEPLTESDVDELENILWSEIGTKEEYDAEYHGIPLGVLIRSINGLDMNAAKRAFSEYLDETTLDSDQMYFVSQVVEYVVRNGVLLDMTYLQESPFTDKGSIVDLFQDLSVWVNIKKAIDSINHNAMTDTLL